ncbi:MAG: T9SS type A sorting domain-containing protein [Bacteroidota bacterium]|nr:T9SS type A sorting domain-containing protein [Bacteroidota bacterium]MDP4232146.1 T9SS type A sorting domain-containing protein [Bacteroidota bacterium]MDP4241146.1 T9SS type A sorting domain-containing protein [Bacteroidota bacterium]MDP4286538.1 T9SS type A sorting domain-containing protein [Bacteroidota bacterium]
MKYFVTLFLLLFAVSARTQITLEHSYQNTTDNGFCLVEVDSGVWKYVSFNRKDSISIFNLDHSLDRVILVPSDLWIRIQMIAKHLFALDSSYQVLLSSYPTQGLRAFKEDGTVLFSCDTCYLGAVQASQEIEGAVLGIRSTPGGTKMIVGRGFADSIVEVYSLPGKLPPCPQKAGIINASSSLPDAVLPTSAYPNPASGRVRIAYDLPKGVASGEMILTSEDGREVKRYHVTNVFSDLLIEATDLPSGSYFYKLVTDKGESPSKRIVWMK